MRRYEKGGALLRRGIAFVMLMLILVFGMTGTVFGAEADPNVTIVNPVADTPVDSTSLLISVKITKPETVRVSVLKENVTMQAITAPDGTVSEAKIVSWNSVFTSDNFTSTSSLSFYTKKLENVALGNYIVRVDTIGADNKVIYQTTRSVSVVEPTVAEVFSSGSNSGVSNFLQSLLKSIFGN